MNSRVLTQPQPKKDTSLTDGTPLSGKTADKPTKSSNTPRSSALEHENRRLDTGRTRAKSNTMVRGGGHTTTFSTIQHPTRTASSAPVIQRLAAAPAGRFGYQQSSLTDPTAHIRDRLIDRSHRLGESRGSTTALQPHSIPLPSSKRSAVHGSVGAGLGGGAGRQLDDKADSRELLRERLLDGLTRTLSNDIACGGGADRHQRQRNVIMEQKRKSLMENISIFRSGSSDIINASNPANLVSKQLLKQKLMPPIATADAQVGARHAMHHEGKSASADGIPESVVPAFAGASKSSSDEFKAMMDVIMKPSNSPAQAKPPSATAIANEAITYPGAYRPGPIRDKAGGGDPIECLKTGQQLKDILVSRRRPSTKTSPLSALGDDDGSREEVARLLAFYPFFAKFPLDVLEECFAPLVQLVSFPVGAAMLEEPHKHLYVIINGEAAFIAPSNVLLAKTTASATNSAVATFGDVVGEVWGVTRGLMRGYENALCKTTVDAVAVPVDELLRALEKTKIPALRERFAALSAVSVLSTLPVPTRRYLAAIAVPHTYDQGQTIMREGDAIDKVAAVVRGKCSIFRMVPFIRRFVVNEGSKRMFLLEKYAIESADRDIMKWLFSASGDLIYHADPATLPPASLVEEEGAEGSSAKSYVPTADAVLVPATHIFDSDSGGSTAGNAHQFRDDAVAASSHHLAKIEDDAESDSIRECYDDHAAADEKSPSLRRPHLIRVPLKVADADLGTVFGDMNAVLSEDSGRDLSDAGSRHYFALRRETDLFLAADTIDWKRAVHTVVAAGPVECVVLAAADFRSVLTDPTCDELVRAMRETKDMYVISTVQGDYLRSVRLEQSQQKHRQLLHRDFRGGKT